MSHLRVTESRGGERESLLDALGNSEELSHKLLVNTFHLTGQISEPIIGRQNGIAHILILLRGHHPLEYLSVEEEQRPKHNQTLLGRKTREIKAG